MTADDVRELFEKHDEEYHKGERIENPPTKRSDLNAFIKLNELVPDGGDIVVASEHDDFFLEPSFEDLAQANITEDDVIYLIRCGVRIDYSGDGLAMFA